MTINVAVNGKTIDPRQLEMHQQNDPFPGGLRYTLCIADSELAKVAALDFPQLIQQVLPQAADSEFIQLIATVHIPAYW